MLIDVLHSLGQTHRVVCPVEDGVVLPNEHITQDPQARAAPAETGAAAVVIRL